MYGATMRGILSITRHFEFSMAHNLPYHNGKCAYIHGHNYDMDITVVNGGNIRNNEDPEYGMVMDFKKLDEIVNENIIEKYDHALVLWDELKSNQIYALDSFIDAHKNDKDLFEDYRIRTVPYRVTAENMCINFAKELYPILEKHNIKLKKIKIWETRDSFAEYEV